MSAEDFVSLLEDVALLIPGVPGSVVKYSARIVREALKRNAAVRLRIELSRRTGTEAGRAADAAAKVAGHESKGSGAR